MTGPSTPVHTYHGACPLVLCVVTRTHIKPIAFGQARGKRVIGHQECCRVRDDPFHNFEPFDGNDRKKDVGLRPIIPSYHSRFILHVLAHAAWNNEREMSIDRFGGVVSWQGTEKQLREHPAKGSIVICGLDVFVSP